MNNFLWLVLISYVAVTFFFPLLPLPLFIYFVLLIFLGSLFAIIHGVFRYGWRGMFFFIVMCLSISNILENVSILTGFPFGYYHYTPVLGPKLFAVPLLIGPAYFSTGYLAWVVANVLLDKADERLTNARKFNVVALPVIASFIMVMWDVIMDPTNATIRQSWIWHSGGGYFGVPLSNYIGWFLTVYLFFQVFALYLAQRGWASKAKGAAAKSYWYQAVLFYLVIGLGYLMNFITDKGGTVADATGYVWSVHAIRESAVVVCLYTMCFVSVLALFRLLAAENKS